MATGKRLLGRLATFVAGDFMVAKPSLGFRLVAPIERAQARRNQQRFCGTYVGITGSVGKTTASYLTAELLGLYGSTALGIRTSTEREILRRLRKLTGPVDFVVQEISGHYPGVIDAALRAARVDVAIVTAVGLDHWSAFRTEEAIAAEKGKLAASVEPGGLVCLNADDQHVRAMASRTRARVILYGRARDADLRVENVTATWPERLRFDLVIGSVRHRVETRFAGTVILPSILAALSVVHGRGLDMERAILRLRELDPLPRRLSVQPTNDQHTYLLDDNKASLWSTLKLVDDLGDWGPVRRILVLGEMSDTGHDASQKYRRVVRKASRTCAAVIGVGRAAIAAERLTTLEGCTNTLAARDLDDVRHILAQQPPSLVILKSSSGTPLGRALPEGTPSVPHFPAQRVIAP